MQPLSFEIYNLRASRRYLKTSGGYVSTMSAVTTKDAQEMIEAAPDIGNYKMYGIPSDVYDLQPDQFERIFDVMRELVAHLQTPTPEPEAKPKKEAKGDYGYIAQAMYKAGIHDVVEVRAKLCIDGELSSDGAFIDLRKSVAMFNYHSSSTFCDESMWLEWAEANNISKFVAPVIENIKQRAEA